MILETERLLLKDYRLDNLDDFFSLKSCIEVWKYSTFIPLKEKGQAKPLLENLLDARNNGKYAFMALFKKDTKVFIGEAGIIDYNPNENRCVVGYNLLPQYWSQGYATEITKQIVKYAFDILGFERIEALAIQDNTASCKVLEKCGFLLEGILRNYNKSEMGYRNVCYYGMISTDLSKIQENL